MNVEFSPEEVTLLVEILVDQVADLQVEINRTDSLAFKEELRQRERHLEQMARKVGSVNPLVQS